MSYTNATYFLDFESGSDTARTALASVTVANNGSGLVRCTKTAHGLVTGAVGTAAGNYVGDWQITRIDADNFDLIASTYSTATGITFTPFGGMNKADAWKTYASGPTAARIAPGDTVRIKATTDATSVGNATWTDASKTLTLAGAVTANISDCETAWTASANVTATADTSVFREGTKSAKLAVAAAFTTGLAAYKATGTIDLSGYQQVSFWVQVSVAIAVSTLSLRLCTDAAGATSVHTIAIPAIPGTSQWHVFTVDLGTNMNAAIGSVALYCDIDPGAIDVFFDNIIACKAVSAADSLNLSSVIGKVHCLSWVASTTYAANDIRRPTQPNRNGFSYKVTAGGGGAAGSSEPTWPQEISKTVTDGALTWTCQQLEETFYPIRSINGTTVIIDGNVTLLASNNTCVYYGTTETVATYKRETYNGVTLTSAGFVTIPSNLIQDGGSASGGDITFSGGWNRTDMTTQTGETWSGGVNGYGQGVNLNSFGYLQIQNLSGVHFDLGISFVGQSNVPVALKNCHWHGCGSEGVRTSSAAGTILTVTNIVTHNNNAVGFNSFGFELIGQAIQANCHVGGSPQIGVRLPDNYNFRINYLTAKGNSSGVDTNTTSRGPRGVISKLVTAANTNQGFSPGASSVNPSITLISAVQTDTLPILASGMSSSWSAAIFCQNYQDTVDNHQITMYGGTIVSATDQRHTASGISWKFRPTNILRSSYQPMSLSVAKIACTANVAVNVTIWTRRDNTNIQGQIYLPGGQLAGVGADLTVACAPSINTWTQSSTLTFTPTAAGIVEIFFRVWDGVGTTNNFWIDDLVVA